MVLLIAALYTAYQNLQERKRRNNIHNDQDAAAAPGGRTGSNNSSGLPESASTILRNDSNTTSNVVLGGGCFACLPAPTAFGAALQNRAGFLPSGNRQKNTDKKKKKKECHNHNNMDATSSPRSHHSSPATHQQQTRAAADARAPADDQDSATALISASGSSSQRGPIAAPPEAGGTSSGSALYSEVFREAVREEWVNAVFGHDFCSSAVASVASNNASVSTAAVGDDSSPAGAAKPTTMRRGVGLAGIPSYFAYSVQIPQSGRNDGSATETSGGADSPTDGNSSYSPRQQEASSPSSAGGGDSKLGMTMSRLPLGLYVYQIEASSEAQFAGVREGSVLVSVNGIPFLAEPSRQALERIWQYEGVFSQSSASNHSQQQQAGSIGGSSSPTAQGPKQVEQNETSATDAICSGPLPSHRVTEPVALELIHGGQLFTVLMLSNPPWGIHWAPCANLCLVKRVYSHAAEAGVKRGSLVAAVNGKTLRALDHADMAMTIRDEFASSKDLNIQLCFTPAASRTGHYDRKFQQANGSTGGGVAASTAMSGGSSSHQYYGNQYSHHAQNVLSSPRANWTAKSYDGVEVKFHSLGYTIGSLCNAGMGIGLGDGGTGGPVFSHKSNVIEELATRVAAGDVLAPAGVMARGNPANKRRLSDSNIHYQGDGAGNLINRVYPPCASLTTHRLFEVWDPLEALLYCLRLYAADYDEERFALILSHQEQSGASSVEAIRFLLSRPYACDMVASYLLQFIGIICAPEKTYLQDEEGKEDEKKTEDGLDHQTHLSKGTAQELTSILLKVSRKDEGFCQRLYFLLRSYISTLETPRPQSSREEGSRNLVALLNCLELLRFAEKELASRSEEIQATSPRQLSTEEASITLALSKSVARTIEQLPPPPPPAPVPPSNPAVSSPTKSTNEKQSRQAVTKKKQGLLCRFRKKKKPHESIDLNEKPVSQTLWSQESRTDGVSKSASPITRRSPARSPASIRRSPVKSPMKSSSVSPRHRSKTRLVRSLSTESLTQSPSVMYENMSDFLGDLDRICGIIERSLQKSFRQKMADWAMQPWSPSKDSALAEVTADMRRNLEEVNSKSNRMLLVNPVDSSELLSSVDYNECYILPSAHFPILLTFNVSERRSSDQLVGEERLYRTKVELVSLKGCQLADARSFVLHGAVAGSISESGMSRQVRPQSETHIWRKDGVLIFDARSSWGAPQTLSLRLSSRQADSAQSGSSSDDTEEVGYGWVDLAAQFSLTEAQTTTTCYAEIWPVDCQANSFDEHGDLPTEASSLGRIELKLKVTTESIGFGPNSRDGLVRKRMLLYKHDDDLRQEAFAVQFISTCDSILKASGLDMKLLTFQCVPVGTKRGFVEWVPGSVPLSEICQPFAGSILGSERRSSSDMNFPSMFSKAGLSKYESLRRLGGQQNDSLRRIGGGSGSRGSFSNNPVQDYLRSVAYDPHAPYLVRRDVMETYVKSCAGYSVIMYVLGVGDRHLDNLLLHQSGSFFHCDFSFILGSDPKMYLPVRVTEDMVLGMGGKSSDNYARFLSMVGAAFLCLRRPENVRVLLSMVRLMEYSCVPDISENQTTEGAVFGIRNRLRLELSEQDAVAYMEELVESSQSSKTWLAVDAIHSLGKKF